MRFNEFKDRKKIEENEFIQGILGGLFQSLLSRISSSNPQFAQLFQNILSGNTNGFNPQRIIQMAPPEARTQVRRALQSVDPDTGDVIPASAAAPDGPGADNPSGWTRLELGDTTYEVGNDYVRQGNQYATFSGNSARAYCQRQNWIMPTAAMCAAIAQQARIIPMPTQPQYDRNSRFYPTGDAAYHTRQILELTGGSFPSGLVAGHKKDVVEGNGSGTCLWGGAKPGGGFWQSGGCPHGGSHEDYSQGLRPIRLPRGRSA